MTLYFQDSELRELTGNFAEKHHFWFPIQDG